MPEACQARRHLRAILVSATRYGRASRAAVARTSLAVEPAAEAIEAVTGRPSQADVERLRQAITEREAVGEWPGQGAASAPPLAPQTAQTIAGTLRSGGEAV